MNDNIFSGHVHVGIVRPAVFPETFEGGGPIVETARTIIEDHFFGAIEITWVKDRNEREKLAGLLESSHMDVVFLAGIPVLNGENQFIQYRSSREITSSRKSEKVGGRGLLLWSKASIGGKWTRSGEREKK